MKVAQQPAYLLHARPYSETSLLVDLFTRDHGRLMVLAKGARGKPGRGGKSHSRGVLLPFKPLLASWTGKGQLPVLTAVEQAAAEVAEAADAANENAAELKGNRLASGFYLNELLLRLLHRHDSHDALFAHYRRAVAQLAGECPPRETLRVFEKKLLHHIGFGAVLDRDAETGEAIDAGAQYHYILEKGPIRANHDRATAGAVAENVLTIGGDTLCALRNETFADDRQLREAQRLTRILINRQLGARALRSRRVIAEMSHYMTAAAASLV